MKTIFPNINSILFFSNFPTASIIKNIWCGSYEYHNGFIHLLCLHGSFSTINDGPSRVDFRLWSGIGSTYSRLPSIIFVRLRSRCVSLPTEARRPNFGVVFLNVPPGSSTFLTVNLKDGDTLRDFNGSPRAVAGGSADLLAFRSSVGSPLNVASIEFVAGSL